ncbi:MAG: TIGR04053 family radical SAM/SPASM domain-containing protein [Candidatus Rokubacteria bacterium]|nr:TIGR04053 family radical SAM/SPASM domain-containing protein [Candidatus Rokubacteria bacterium]
MTAGYVFERAPLRVYWELTRACDLACRHCRAEAIPSRHPEELMTEEGFRLLDQLAEFGPPAPHVVLTGGDPLKRPDLLALVEHGVGAGLPISVSPSATGLLTRERVLALKAAGVEAMSLSLDGSTAELHDGVRGIPGTFAFTVGAAREVVESGIPLQINTLVTAETAADLPAIHRLVGAIGAQRLSLFFLISVGRGRELGQLTPDECEALLHWVYDHSRDGRPAVTTTEAPHYRRVVLERLKAEGRTGEALRHHPLRRGFGIRDGNGVMFISHTGEIHPSGFLPLPAGNVKVQSPVEIYRDAPLFKALRAPERYEGKCGRCEYRAICGGSRARAYAATGDPLGSDPLCAYEP